jgi:2-polyprenyl-6-hydroxyphenyl methylase/3-demethylubiquinone-9 3-methyltransferase
MGKRISGAAAWKAGGHRTESPEDLRRRPRLPSGRRLSDRRLLALFRRHGELGRGMRVLEIGCGRSPWLPCLAMSFGCRMSGIDADAYAVELARANLAGAGVSGEILCRDAFDAQANEDLRGRYDLVYSMGLMEHFADPAPRLAVLSGYLKSGGRLITTVPNLQGVNGMLQRFASRQRLSTHAVYDERRLAAVHRDAGLQIVSAGYVGFYDGYFSASDPTTSPLRGRVHAWLSRTTNLTAAAWARAAGARFAPETKWLAPHVYCVGRRTD